MAGYVYLQITPDLNISVFRTLYHFCLKYETFINLHVFAIGTPPIEERIVFKRVGEHFNSKAESAAIDYVACQKVEDISQCFQILACADYQK